MSIGDHVLALDIGGTKLAAGVVHRSGEVLSFVRTPTRVEQGPETVVKRLLDLGREALAGHGAAAMAGVGMGPTMTTSMPAPMKPAVSAGSSM